MDPLEKLDLSGDSTFAIGLEAQKRKYNLFHFTPDHLFYKNKKVFAKAISLTLGVQNGHENFKYGKSETHELSKFDIILMRQDPPFDLAYITATHLLEKISKKTLIINNPYEVRNAPEKIFVTQFEHIMPKTMITRDVESIKLFRHKYKDIIIKPLYGNGGAGIIRSKDDELIGINIDCEYLEMPIMAQKYIPEISEGDRRIIFFDGDYVGSVARIPEEGSIKANFHAGGSAKKTGLVFRDQQIIDTLGKKLKKLDLFFVGIDIIGNYLTEINVTSPTGLKQINALNNVKLEKDFWDKLEAKYKLV